MKFMMFVCYTPAPEAEPAPEPADTAAPAAAATDESADAGGDDSFPWLDEVMASGVRLDGDRLAAPSAAKTVRMRNGQKLVVDGPFAETKEVIAGYDVLECDTLEEAIEIASRHPVAEFGMIEVRPFWVG